VTKGWYTDGRKGDVGHWGHTGSHCRGQRCGYRAGGTNVITGSQEKIEMGYEGREEPVVDGTSVVAPGGEDQWRQISVDPNIPSEKKKTRWSDHLLCDTWGLFEKET
jgi:hypothetical protein